MEINILIYFYFEHTSWVDLLSVKYDNEVAMISPIYVSRTVILDSSFLTLLTVFIASLLHEYPAFCRSSVFGEKALAIPDLILFKKDWGACCWLLATELPEPHNSGVKSPKHRPRTGWHFDNIKWFLDYVIWHNKINWNMEN